MTPLAGFAPDADAVMPGVITACVNFVPYINGMEGGPAPTTPSDAPALAASCIGAAVVENLAGLRRIMAGTATKLYELSGGAWVDRSRAAVYTGGADTRWSFAQFGDATLAANLTDTMQRSTTAAFADIAGAPKANVVFSVGAFVMALNTVDAVGTKQDGWHCSASFDDLDWTPSVATQCTRGRLVSTPGPITAGARLGEYAVAYKAKAVYLGQYVGPPVVWDWIQVPGGDAGCVGKEALCDIGGTHFFVGNDNMWLFDGTRPVPIGDGAIRQWFYNNSNPQFRYRTQCVFDRQNNRVWVYYPSTGSTTCNAALVYHVLTKKWGIADRAVQAALSYVAPGVTYDTLSTAGATYDTLIDVPYDSQYWLAGGQALSIFNASNQIQLMTGSSLSSSFTTGDAGDDDAVSLLSRIRLRYAPAMAPTTASVQTFHKMTSGASYTSGPSGSINDGKFDVLRSARWHQARFDFTGPVQVTGMNAQVKPGGQR